MKHMVIGLGGAGGRIIRAMRRTIARDYPHGKGNPAHLNPATGMLERDAPLGFLYVDSNESELNSETDWNYLGQSVQLENMQRLYIREGDLGAAIDNLGSNPALARWLGSPDKLRGIFKGTMGAPGANQVRRWGRFLFANSTATFIRAKVLPLLADFHEHGGDAATTFHICCTLAGGTGSGAVVDTIMQLRKLYPTGGGIDCPIYLYCLVTNSECEAARDNFFANQYAALLELNALASMNWHPHDVLGTGNRLQELRDRFVLCNLISDTNCEGQMLPLDRQEELVAEYLYNRIVICEKAVSPTFAKSWTLEDVRQHSGEPANVRRSYYFGTIGVKRWAVPVVEIEERLAFDCALSVVRQMLYNRWDDDVGYVDKAEQRDLDKVVRDAMESGRWRLSDDQTMLRTNFELQSVHQPAPDWEVEWRGLVQAHRIEIEKGGGEKSEWLRRLKTVADEHVQTGFRGLGIQRWFHDRMQSVDQYAQRILDQISADLWSDWRNGNSGIDDLRRLVDTLSNKLNARRDAIDGEQAECSRLIKDLDKKLQDAAPEWAKIGWLSSLLGIRHKLLTNYERCLWQAGIQRARHEALDFQRNLLGLVRDRLNGLLGEIARVIQCLFDLAAEFALAVNTRCLSGQERQFQELLVREYDPSAIRQLGDEIRKLSSVQGPLAQHCRESIENMMGPDPGLAQLATEAKLHVLRPILLKHGAQAARLAHGQLVAARQIQPVLDAGIIERLENRYVGNEQVLRQDVEKFVKSAATSCLLDLAQDSPAVVFGRPELQRMPIHRALAFIPGGAHVELPFAQMTRDRFINAGIADMASSPRSSEITVLSADFWAALRFFRVVAGLKQRYLLRLKSDPIAAQLEIHLEDWDRPLPDLFPPSGEEQRSLGMALLLLGEVLGHLVERDVRGRREWVWETRNPSGMATASRILAERREDFAALAPEGFNWLHEQVVDAIKVEQRTADSPAAAKTALNGKLDKRLNDLWQKCGENEPDRNSHPEFLKMRDVVQAAKAIIKEVEQ